MTASDGIRPATVEDAPALSRLFREVFVQERATEVWRWKFFDHPVGAWSMVFEAEGEIVAHCGATAVPFHASGTKILAVQLVDFMSSPRYAGGLGAGGVFARTTGALFRAILSTTDARLLYGFPGERHRLAGERLLGYKTVAPVAELRLRTRDEMIESRELVESDLSRFEEIPSKLHAIRTREILKWRYLRHPDAGYEIVETSKSLFRRKPSMSAIVRRRPDGIRLMEIGGSFEQGALTELADRLSGLGADVVGWCSPEQQITARLRKAGFEMTERDHYIAAAWFLEHPDPARRNFFSEEPPMGEDFYVSLGDYDVD